jgi:hypothetical protein
MVEERGLIRSGHCARGAAIQSSRSGKPEYYNNYFTIQGRDIFPSSWPSVIVGKVLPTCGQLEFESKAA